MPNVNEDSVAEWTVNLIGPEGTASVPTTAEWRLWCDETNAALSDWATLTPTTIYDDAGDPEETEVTITVSPTLNAMQTSTKPTEKKRIAVSTNRGLATERNFEIEYTLVRLKSLG